MSDSIKKIDFQKSALSFLLAVFLCGNAFCESVQNLLSGYLENDLLLQRYSITVQSKSLDLDSTKIKNGINVKLSSGNMKIQTSSDGNRRISVSPNAQFSLPKADLSAEAGVSIVKKNGETEVSSGSISATVGILTNNRKKRKIELLQAERSLLEAERNVKSRAVSAEKEFFTELKSIFQQAVSVFEADEDLFDYEKSLRVLSAQGYSKQSASFRQANLKVKSAERACAEKRRIFVRKTAVFAKKCGIDFAADSFENAREFLPSEIPFPTLLDFLEFDRELYSELEKAKYEKFINDLKRAASGGISLSATGEYKISDSFYSSGDSGSDSAGGKLTFSYQGISASAGAFFPIGKRIFGGNVASGTKPYFEFSLAFSAGDFFLGRIEKKENALSEKLDELSVKSSEDSYENDLTEKITEFRDVKWSQESLTEELSMYTDLEKDMARWLKSGIVTESDWRDARNRREKASANLLANAIDQHIFNSKVRLLFIDGDSN